MSEVNQDFEKWAKYYSGCDGGNLNGKIWVCGIEYGAAKNQKHLMNNKPLDYLDVLDPPYLRNDCERAQFIKHSYNWKFLKMYSVILGKSTDVNVYKNVYERTMAFDRHSDLFKLNLYPLAFNCVSNTLWETEQFEKTGFQSKINYVEWCRKNRFPKISGWAKSYKPRAIICTGIGYFDDFHQAFSGVIAEPQGINEEINGKLLRWCHINDSESILFVTPFLGWKNGISSDVLLKAFGEKIRTICDDHFGHAWCKQFDEFA